ncbi:MAG: hypothetical protein JRF72_19025 [Deltaproteobacteria bacterium]|jgi:hypothetical protein|nr:hypothetical protein [Deltaproteobacteria bacterium]
MRRLTVLLFICFLPAVCFANPFLVCDPQTGVAEYEIYMDGVRMGNAPAQADGSLLYDLQGITPGQYTWTATACNEWGCSELSDPYESPAPVGKPSGVRLKR